MLAHNRAVALDAVRGPAWSPPGLDLVGGRYPLRVEGHGGRLAEGLIGGVITTNSQARQHSVHVLGWDEAARRGLDQKGANELVRRMEVVFASVSLRHDCSVLLRGPHGGQQVEAEIDHDGY